MFTILKKKDSGTLNRYGMGIWHILQRLKWDMRPITHRNRAKLKSWKDYFAGQKALILCNGPSLNLVDWDLIQKSNIFTFGLNKIHLLFNRVSFRPSAIVAVNPFVISQCQDTYNTLDIPLFLDQRAFHNFAYRPNIHFLDTDDLCGKFAKDCSLAVNQGYTVTYVAMQLAFHMGFQSVGLVGCDHFFEDQGPANTLVRAQGKDKNHFDPSYFSNNDFWQLADLPGAEFHYEIAKRTYAQAERTLVNCSIGGYLEVLDKQELAMFLQV